MQIEIKKLNALAIIPTKAHNNDAGFDLTVISIEYDNVNDVISYGTGLAINIPEGYVGLLFPRSSVYKKGLSLANSIGVIDSGYQGEVILKFRTIEGNTDYYKIGERAAQLVIIPIPIIELVEVKKEFEVTDRNLGGFGSSDKQDDNIYLDHKLFI